MCSQMHGLVFTTRAGRAALQPDHLAGPARAGAASLRPGHLLRRHGCGISPDELRQLGNELRPGLPMGLLFWLAEQGRLPGR